MAFRVRFRLQGAGRYLEALRRLPAEERKAVDEAFQRVAGKVVRLAQERAPVRTGRLRASITRRRIRIFEHAVEARAPYAGFVEWGTRRMAARPYLRPAVRAAAPFLRGVAREKLREALARLRGRT